MKNRGSVDKNHKINKIGKRYFEACLDPGDWIDRPEGVNESDYHIDYCLELVEEDNPSGKQVRVQLKSRKSLKVKGGLVKQNVRTRHLRYWAKDCDLPVFLVVVDVEKKRGYAVFVQEWFDLQSLKSEWETQEKIQMSFRDEYPIEDSKKLKDLACRAKEYMREKYPGSIEAAIKAKRERIESLDPRFHVDINYVDRRTAISLSAKEEVSLKLTVKGADEVEKLNSTIGFGMESQIPAENIEFEGSELIQALMKEKGGVLSFGPSESSPAEFRFFDNKTNEFLFLVPAVVTKGVFGGTIRSSEPAHPFCVDVVVHRDRTVEPRVSVRMVNWTQIPIQKLNHLGDLMRVVRLVENDHELRLDIVLDGEIGSRLHASVDSLSDVVRSCGWWVRLLHSVRNLARLLKIEITPDEVFRVIDKDSYRDILEICEMFESRVYRVGDVVAQFTVSRRSIEMDSILNEKNVGGTFSVEYDYVEIDVLGVKAKVSKLRYEFTCCEVCFDANERVKFEDGRSVSLEVCLKYREESKVEKSYGAVLVLERKNITIDGS